jgi:hypothetical protein
MVNPISSSQASHLSEAAQSAAPKPQVQTQQKATSQPSDTVKLKSTGNADHDGS